MAAIQQKGKQQSKNRVRPQKKSKLLPLPPRPAGSQSGQHQKTDTAPSTVAREDKGLCFYHWSFGDRVHSTFLPGPLLLAGKLIGWGVIGAIHPGKLVHVVDNNSGHSFLVDTGSSYSILPHSSTLPPTGPLLKAANGQHIPCWGRRQQSISFGGHSYSWSFLLAAVDFNILGVDFLHHFQLSVNVAEKRLQPQPVSTATATVNSIPAQLPSSPSAGPALHLDLQEEALLHDFAGVLNAEGRLPPSTHGVEHHIVTKGRPVTAKFRRLDNTKLAGGEGGIPAAGERGNSQAV